MSRNAARRLIPSVRLALWFALLLAGNVLLVAGLFLTRVTWRPDVVPFGRGSPILQIMIHPERFATGDRLRQIRFLNVLGCALIAAAVGVLLYDLGSVSIRG